MLVEQFIRAQRADAETGRTPGPGLSKHALERCCFSMVRQVVLCRMMFPIVPLLIGVGELPRDFVRTTAEHITAFSLGTLNERSRQARGDRSPRRAGGRR